MMQQQPYRWWFMAVLLLGWASAGQAQLAGPQDPCRNPMANVQGVGNGDIQVGLTAVTIFAVNQTRVSVIVLNTSATDDVRCMTNNQGIPTASAGFRFPHGQSLAFSLEGQREMKCIREASATADVFLSAWECLQ